jgi:hypothetical protein
MAHQQPFPQHMGQLEDLHAHENEESNTDPTRE